MALSDNYPLVTVPGAKGIWHIYGRSPEHGGDAWCHLVPGGDKALLIDTAFGIGDLKSLVSTLTDKEVIVANTHFHLDHTLGNPQFSEVMIHEYDVPQLKKMMTIPHRIAPDYETRAYEYGQEDLVQPGEYGIIPLHDGDVIDLGDGYELEVFHLPGHSMGGCAFLDRKRRFLYSGDAIVWTPTFCKGPADRSLPHSEYFSVEKFRDGLVRLNEHLDEFDVLYPGHSRLGLDKKIVPDMLACAEELLAGDRTAQFYTPSGHCPVHVHGMAKIAFEEDRIFA